MANLTQNEIDALVAKLKQYKYLVAAGATSLGPLKSAPGIESETELTDRVMYETGADVQARIIAKNDVKVTLELEDVDAGVALLAAFKKGDNVLATASAVALTLVPITEDTGAKTLTFGRAFLQPGLSLTLGEGEDPNSVTLVYTCKPVVSTGYTFTHAVPSTPSATPSPTPTPTPTTTPGLFIDLFNRTEAPISTNWAVFGDAVVPIYCNGSRAVAQAASNGGKYITARCTADVGQANMRVSADLFHSDSWTVATQVGIMIRANASNQYYVAALVVQTTRVFLHFYRNAAGSLSLIGNGGPYTYATYGTPVSATISAVGNLFTASITCTIGTTPNVTATDATFTGTGGGLFSYPGAAWVAWDNYRQERV